MTLDINALSEADMSKLCDNLADNEEKQRKIYEVYTRVADMDERMRELKKEEL